jgi:CHAT domain-containing protein/tetratricopeptide (TPR) repeat protein
LREGEFLHIAVEQRGIDLIASLIDPDGKLIVEVNSRKELQETETILAIASEKGYHHLEVRPTKEAEKEAKAGSYAVNIVALRKVTVPDRALVSADAMMREADRLRAENKPESNQQAVEKYKSVLAQWRTLGNREREADALGALGGLSRTLREYEQSLDYFNQALRLRRELGDRRREANALGNIGQAYEEMKQHKQALDYYRQALPLLRETGNQRGEAVTLTNIGSVHYDLGEQQPALEHFEQAIAAWRKLGDQNEEAGAHVRAGRAFEAVNNRPKALESYNEALKVYRAAKDQAGEASALLDLGVVNREVGNNRQALEYFSQALPLWRSLGRKGEEASILNFLGLVYRTLGEKESALEHYNQALALSRELKNQRLEATVLNNIASVYYSFGDRRKALESFNEVLPLRRAAGDRLGEASTLTNIGGASADLGENQQALEFYNQALPIWRDLKRRVEEVIVLQNISETYDRLGEKQMALDQYNQALAQIRQLGAKQIEGAILTNLATLYSTLGEKQKAQDFYLQSLEIHRATGNRTVEADTLHLLGFLHFEMDDTQKALEYLGQALPLWRQLKDKRGEAMTLTATAMVYRSTGERDKSLEYSNQALPLHREVGNRAGEAETLINIGLILSASGEKQRAIEHFKHAVELSQAISDPLLEAKSHYEIARVNLDLANLDDSRKQIEETLGIVERLRSKVASQELRTSYFATVQKFYDFYIELLMRMHERQSDKGFDGEALQASERARARSLLEILAEANANIREGVDVALIERERALQQQLNGKADALARLFTGRFAPEQADALRKEIDALKAAYEQVRAEIRQASPRYAALTQPTPLSLKEIQQQLLDDDTLLLEYSLGDERSFLWAVTRSKITSFALPPRAEIEDAARQVYELLSKPNQVYRQTASQRRLKHKKSDAAGEEIAPDTEALYALSDMLLKPVASQLGNRRLVIVAEGALQYIPFSALPRPVVSVQGSGGRLKARSRRTPAAAERLPLIVDHEVVSLPSASTLAALRRDVMDRQPAPKTLAVIADPVFEKDDERVKVVSVAQDNQPQGPKTIPTVAEERLIKHLKKPTGGGDQSVVLRISRLPFTRQEAEQIASLAPESERKQAVDFAASRATAMASDLTQYRFVHFATHGYLDSERPELSALVLSLVDEKGAQQSGFLYAHEVYNLKLPAEVVVLSACETGLGKEIKGEGLVGLTRGFMYAGAPRVVVSLWSVNDKATSELMAKFYRRMLAEKMRPAAALRAAQIEMWKQQQWQAPYFWAAFVVQGEWR